MSQPGRTRLQRRSQSSKRRLTPQRRTKCIDAEMGALSSTDGTVVSSIKRRLLNQKNEIEAILLMGSTAFKSEFRDWDDFDVQVYTRSKPARGSYYEILNDSGRHYLLSVYYFQLDPANHPVRDVAKQKDVQVLFGRKESLRHILVDRPRRIEPLRHELREFDARYERYFEILVDIFFILNRYEAKGKANATKPRVARDALRTLSRHFFEFYGVSRSIPNRTRWKSLLSEVDRLLDERGFANECQNTEFAETAIDLMMPSARMSRVASPRRRKSSRP